MQHNHRSYVAILSFVVCVWNKKTLFVLQYSTNTDYIYYDMELGQLSISRASRRRRAGDFQTLDRAPSFRQSCPPGAAQGASKEGGGGTPPSPRPSFLPWM
jgi:hypothetical protein